MTASDFRTSGCAWCHPGGGPLEYDRAGYRFDGAANLFNSGANPAPKNADYFVFGTQAGADASAYAGAGFFEVTSTTGVLAVDQVINQGTVKAVLDPATGTYKTVGKKYTATATAGVAEVDCLMCHYSGRFANLERNYAFPAATAPKLAASLGLVGQGTGEPGLLNIATKGAPTINPNPATTGWSWNERVGVPGVPGNPVTLTADQIRTSPRKENCATCHFPDRSMASTGCADPAKCGPSSKPLGFTVFQKYMGPGSTRDTDEIIGVNGRDGNNDVAWTATKGRSEGGKRGESINDNLNRDAHMKWPAYGAPGMDCTDCHQALEGTFAALTDGAGNVVVPAVTIEKIDHHLAKGDNTPDGKNMDQLDNTVTCAACHIDGTHPNAGGAPNPAAEHAGIPAFHFQQISCKTCHIPWVNGPVDQDLADFTAGPYQTFERTQTTEAPTTGVNRRPLYLWRETDHGHGPMQIQPFGLMSVALVASASSKSGDEAASVTPTYQRLAKRAAEQLRAQYGDANADGLYDWPLNAPQGGDRALVVNKRTELVDYFNQIATIPGAPANPVIHLYFNQFSVSHNTRPLNESTNRILGTKAAGGCAMCHSSSDVANPNYSASSVGFFDKTVSLFNQPTDGGNGLVQTTLPAAAPLTGDIERISIKFPFKRADGTSGSIDLSGTDGQKVGNTVRQGEALGYSADRIAALQAPQRTSYDITVTSGPNGTASPTGTVGVTARGSQTVRFTPDAGYGVQDVLVNGTSVGAVTSYTFSSVVADHSISATFAPNPGFTITASAGANGTISPAGSTSVLGGQDVTYTITPAPGYRIATLVVDGENRNPHPTHIFRDVAADHTIAATFELDVFTLSSSTFGSGSITPLGATTLARGASQTYTITPTSGFRISRVVVNGVNKGAISEYTFTNVTSNATIKAYFVIQRAVGTSRNTLTNPTGASTFDRK